MIFNRCVHYGIIKSSKEMHPLLHRHFYGMTSENFFLSYIFEIYNKLLTMVICMWKR